LQADAIVIAPTNTCISPIHKNSRLNIWQACRKTVTSFWQYYCNSRLISNSSSFWPSYQFRNSLLSDSLISLSP
jgi:hypothetical protein